MRILCADFETTVYRGQTETEVWSAACVEVNDASETVYIFNSIEKYFEFLFNLDEDLTIYFHNLRFDGTFILIYLLRNGYDQALAMDEAGNYTGFSRPTKMPERSFKYLISDKRLWYDITIKTATGKIIDIRDSLKLLPFTLQEVGKAFKTKHQKLDMEYAGERHAGGEITKEEREYIKNDVLVLKEAVEILLEQGHDKLTIGSCCMDEFRKTVLPKDSEAMLYYSSLPDDYFKGFLDGRDYRQFFPNLYEYTLDEKEHKYSTAGEYILKSYSGGWCYIVPEKANKVFHDGITADVNSLYPSMMHSSSGNYYPIGSPHFWTGNIPENIKDFRKSKKFYYVRIKCYFDIKDGYLPFVRIRGNPYYSSKESATTSNIILKRDCALGGKGSVIKKYYDHDGVLRDTKVELILTWNEYELFLEHYNVSELEVLDGCWFYSTKGIFDVYINYWFEIKKNSKGAMRTLAKLFLNNLYGKFASSTNSSFIVASLNKETGLVDYNIEPQYTKAPGYIAIGAAITSYARCFTVRAAQSNFYGKDKPGFIYADTDSIHCDITADKVKGIKTHPTDLSCWKLESYWDEAIFVRQKTYIEHVTHEDGVPVEKPYYNVKCAGMGKTPKRLVNLALNGKKAKDIKDKGLNWSSEFAKFLEKGMKLTDFKVGLKVPGNLKQAQIKGGIVLVEHDYKMRPRGF